MREPEETIINIIFHEETIIDIILYLLVLFIILFLLGLGIEASTTETIATERVKCLDKQGAEFEEEYCIKEIKCGAISKLFNIEGCNT